MELQGKIIAILPLQSGQGKNGEWKKQEFVIESGGQYPKKVAFTNWGDKVQLPAEGTQVTVSFDAESREYNGKYYTELKVWKVAGGGAAAQPAPAVGGADDGSGLPF